MSEIELGDKVVFEFNEGQDRIGRVVGFDQQSGWDERRVQVAYRGSKSWRWEREVNKLTPFVPSK